MKKEEAISYLQQLYPNGGHCWLDEQRIEAIDMAIDALQEEPQVKEFAEIQHVKETCKENDNSLTQEPVSEEWVEELREKLDSLSKEDFKKVFDKYAVDFNEEPVSEGLDKYINELSKQFPEVSFAKLSQIAIRVAKWQKEQDQSTIELAEDHAMLAGMEKMREELISKLRRWVSSKNERDYFTFVYIDRHFDELLKEAMKDE